MPIALGHVDLAIDRRLGGWRSNECVTRSFKGVDSYRPYDPQRLTNASK
jgi:hypothetical protein